jgi:hypothetical protein
MEGPRKKEWEWKISSGDFRGNSRSRRNWTFWGEAWDGAIPDILLVSAPAASDSGHYLSEASWPPKLRAHLPSRPVLSKT